MRTSDWWLILWWKLVNQSRTCSRSPNLPCWLCLSLRHFYGCFGLTFVILETRGVHQYQKILCPKQLLLRKSLRWDRRMQNDKRVLLAMRNVVTRIWGRSSITSSPRYTKEANVTCDGTLTLVKMVLVCQLNKPGHAVEKVKILSVVDLGWSWIMCTYRRQMHNYKYVGKRMGQVFN